MIVGVLVSGRTAISAAIWGLATFCCRISVWRSAKFSPYKTFINLRKNGPGYSFCDWSCYRCWHYHRFFEPYRSRGKSQQLPRSCCSAKFVAHPNINRDGRPLFGLGMPTSAAYIVCAAILVPTLIHIGVPTLSAHFFAMFYASLSVITPPVALASYMAAAIANSDPWKTGIQGFKLALAVYYSIFLYL